MSLATCKVTSHKKTNDMIIGFLLFALLVGLSGCQMGKVGTLKHPDENPAEASPSSSPTTPAY